MPWTCIVYCTCETMDLLLDSLSVKNKIVNKELSLVVSKHFSLSKVTI